MLNIIDSDFSSSSLSPTALAFVGDTVFDLLVRSELVIEANRPVGQLHKAASERVCAAAQSEYAKKLLEHLNGEELETFKRGRNAHTGRPKNQSMADYHYATGFECLLGKLYLDKRFDRIKELYEIIKAE